VALLCSLYLYYVHRYIISVEERAEEVRVSVSIRLRLLFKKLPYIALLSRTGSWKHTGGLKANGCRIATVLENTHPGVSVPLP
jgi:hypothetical protein